MADLRETVQKVIQELVLPDLAKVGEIKTMLEFTNKRIDDAVTQLTDQSRRIDETNNRIDDTNNRIDETNKRIDEVRTELATRIDETNKRIDEVRTELATRIDETNKRIDEVRTELTTRIDGTNKRIDSMSKEVSVLRTDLSYQITELGRTMVTRGEQAVIDQRLERLEQVVEGLQQRVAA